MSEALQVLVATVPKSRREEVRFALTEFRGRKFADVRVWVDMGTPTGHKTATKAGLSFAFDSLPALAEAMQRLADEARAMGLIGGEN